MFQLHVTLTSNIFPSQSQLSLPQYLKTYSYICSTNVQNYDHFSSGRCPLHDNTEARHDEEVKKAEAAALAKVRAENPDLTDDDLKIKVSETVKRTEQRRAQRAQAEQHPLAGIAVLGGPPPPPPQGIHMQPMQQVHMQPMPQMAVAVAMGQPQGGGDGGGGGGQPAFFAGAGAGAPVYHHYHQHQHQPHLHLHPQQQMQLQNLQPPYIPAPNYHFQPAAPGFELPRGFQAIGGPLGGFQPVALPGPYHPPQQQPQQPQQPQQQDPMQQLFPVQQQHQQHQHQHQHQQHQHQHQQHQQHRQHQHQHQQQQVYQPRAVPMEARNEEAMRQARREVRRRRYGGEGGMGYY